MIRFTVITVTYNAGDKLKETVTDSLKQTYDNYEILIKDGLSTDDSLKKLPQSEKIKLVSCKDKGIYDAMNQAVAEATGDYIIFMNCGDYFYDENVLSNIEKEIQEEPDRGIYYGDVYWNTTGIVNHSPTEITDFVCFRHIPCHQSCVFARKLFEEKSFDLEYKIRADYEFFLRQYYKNNIRPKYLGFVLSNYEGGGYSETKENRKRDKNEHRKITSMYMKKGKLFLYRFIMLITLQPLRQLIAQRSKLAGTYDKAKAAVYHANK